MQCRVGGQVLIDLTSDSRHVFDTLVEYEGAEDPRVPSCRREDDPAELAVRLADYVREIEKRDRGIEGLCWIWG
eukprot:COSAG02_NODE_3041_length_7489_cov_7.290798_10_plen_74_part_00